MKKYNNTIIGLLLLSISLILGGCASSSSSKTEPWKNLRDSIYKTMNKDNAAILNAFKAKDYQKAIEEIHQKRAQKKKVSHTLYTYEGYAYLQLRQYKKALLMFDKSVALNTNKLYGPGHVLVHRAKAYYKTDQYQRAIKDASRALSHRWAKDSANRFYQAIGKTFYSKSLVQIDLLSLRAQSYQRTKQYDLALKDFDSISAFGSDKFSAYAYYMKSKIHYDRAAYQKALVAINLTLNYNKHVDYYNLKGLIFLMQGSFKEAHIQFTKATHMSQNLTYLYNHALGLWFIGKKDDALYQMQRVVSQRKSAHSYYHAGYFLHKKGRYEEAKTYFLKAQQKDAHILSKRLETLNSVPILSPTKKIYQEEYDIATAYIKEGKVFTAKKPSKPMLTLEKLFMTPNPVPTGESFSIDFSYTLQLPSQKSADVIYYFKIIKDKKTLFKASEKRSEAKSGVKKSIKIPMKPVKKRGEYTITLFLKYGKLSETKSEKLIIR